MDDADDNSSRRSSPSLGSGLSHLFSRSHGAGGSTVHHRMKRSSKHSSPEPGGAAAASIMNDTSSVTTATTGASSFFHDNDDDVENDGRSSLTSGEGKDGDFMEQHSKFGSGLVGKLQQLPKRMKSRKQKRREAEEEEVERGRSVAERGTLENVVDTDGGDGYRFERHLTPTTALEQGDGSSTLTYESDTENALPTPPPLLSHPSHLGFLTTSSPAVRASIAVSNSESVAQLNRPTKKASTFPLESDAVATTETSEVSVARELQPPTESAQKRTPSPVGRLAAALKPRRSSSSNSDPERPKSGGGLSVKDKGAGGGSSRRGSVVSKFGNIFPDRPSSSSKSSPERPSTANSIPQTPPNPDKPLIINTPPTPTDHTAPQFPPPQQNESPKIPPPIIANPNIVTSPSGNMISHRRLRSGSATLGPSKLSNITSAPLTPTPENGISSPQTGFFSNAWSAAQSAASTLTNSITNTNSTSGQSRNRSGSQETQVDGDDVEVEILSEKVATSGEAAEEKELAVKTLGMGDLSLSHLGISETTSDATTPTTIKLPDNEETRGRSGTAESLPSRMSANNMVGDSLENGSSAHVEDYQSPPVREAATFPVLGSQTPPNGSVFEGKGGVHRSGSVRSALGSRRRKRGSSAATGNASLGTIGAAIAAANHSLANPNSQSGSTPKLTGFAVASKKRNRDFHQLFRSVPDDDYLIEDYSCALQKEILAHGRLYVSEGHLCFSSNILGWVNTLVMSFDEIVSVEKRSTALVFRNGLMISTLHAKHIFASFTSRDLTYDLIVGIWKLGHPSLRSSLNGVRLDETGGDKTEKDDTVLSQEASGSEDESEDGDEVYDEDDDGMSFTQAVEGSVAGSEVGDTVLSRKVSATVLGGIPADKGNAGTTSVDSKDYPGPITHPPTDCTDQENHYDRMLLDEVIPAPLGKIYSLMFGPNSSAWMSRWLSVDQKCLELVMEDKKGLSDENRSRNYSYIKPLNAAIGPKQTKCITTETLDFMDLERSVSVTMSTQTPDVPSGNVFLTKTRYCLSWAEGGATRMQVNCTIEWSGKSWLKSPIEKGANEGQIQYSRDLVAGLKAAISAKPKAGGAVVTVKGSKKKGKKGEKSANVLVGPGGVEEISVHTKKAAKSSDWGLLEPVHDILKPLLDIISPLLSGNMLYGLLVGLLLAYWFRGSATNAAGGGVGFLASPARIVAYEEIWRREESELWDWLEERVSMERRVGGVGGGVGSASVGVGGRGGLDMDKEFKERLDGGGGKISVSAREVRELEVAIRVTEDKLNALKGVVERRKGERERVKEKNEKEKEGAERAEKPEKPEKVEDEKIEEL